MMASERIHLQQVWMRAVLLHRDFIARANDAGRFHR